METATKPATLLEAFSNTAATLRQSGLERVRILGLSEGCDASSGVGQDGVRVLTEHDFMREFIFASRPCIILDAINAWPAMHKWRSDSYLFDLDHQLPSEDEKDSDDDGDEAGEEDREEEVEVTEDAQNNAEESSKTPSGADPDSRRTVSSAMKDAAPKKRGPKKVTVALTPNGRADAVTSVLYDVNDIPSESREDIIGVEAKKIASVLKSHPLCSAADAAADNVRMEKIFMYAAEVKVTLPELYQLLRASPVAPLPQPIFIDMRRYKRATDEHATPVVAYAQMQNNCLNSEYTHLHGDIYKNVEQFGTRVFGAAPEAANVWFGIPASVSSFHQDWVENLYPVVRGVKEFILIPPWTGPVIPKPNIPSAAFELDSPYCDRTKLRFDFKPYPAKDGTVVPWMDFDLEAQVIEGGGEAAVEAALAATVNENEARKAAIHPKLFADRSSQRSLPSLHPLVAYVHPGETLYLPALWLHRVAQHADETDVRARAQHRMRSQKQQQHEVDEPSDAGSDEAPPLPLIAAVNYWYNMNMTNPAVVLLQEFGLLL